jgi:hypothetical protein
MPISKLAPCRSESWSQRVLRMGRGYPRVPSPVAKQWEKVADWPDVGPLPRVPMPEEALIRPSGTFSHPADGRRGYPEALQFHAPTRFRPPALAS